MVIHRIDGANRYPHYTRTRTACRGIVVQDGNILMSYEKKTDQWFTPGGGLEHGETLDNCCRRELAEETGCLVVPGQHFLTVEEYYEEWQFISHYFICAVEGETERKLTEQEIKTGLEPRWIPLETAKDIFSHHQDYAGRDEMKRGAYQREYEALRCYELQRFGQVKLSTERLFLREMTEADFDALYAVLADSDIMQHYPYTFDAARVKNWIVRNQDRYRTFGFGLWALCLRETGEMIGDCGLTMQMIHGTIRPEIGYHIRADHQRCGYAREAATAVRDWAFSTLPFGEIYSYMKCTNESSARAAQSWGCRFVEEFEDEVNERTHVYRIDRETWERIR